MSAPRAPVVAAGGSSTRALDVEDSSQVGEARRVAGALATRVGLDETQAGRVALVATELATNLVKYAKRGQLLLRPVGTPERPGVELASVDAGPGMTVSLAMRDGFSTAGSRGVGLGAVERSSTVFDIASWAGVGSFVLSQVFARYDAAHESAESAPPHAPVTDGGVCVPYPGELVCGDAWSVLRFDGFTLLAVADGLGHGVGAGDASRAFLGVVTREAHRAPRELLELAHVALKGTRGAAAAVARITAPHGEAGDRVLVYAGVGNVAGDVLRPDGSVHSCVSVHGIVGAQLRKVSEMTYTMPPGSLLVLASDGLSTSWRLDRTPGLRERHPALVAAALYGLYRRGRDDVTVVVHRIPETP